MTLPVRWTPRQLQRDAATATANFRRERLDEPLGRYSHFFTAFVPIFRSTVDRLPQLAAGEFDGEILAAMVRDEDSRTAFRYLAAPISADDLRTLAETTLSAGSLRRNPAEARRVRDTVLRIVDPHRFPWVRKSRRPTRHERELAVVASAAMVAAQKVETERRNTAKKDQENRVIKTLRRAGFREVRRRPVALLSQAPGPGQFCAESELGDTRADLIVCLRDGRVMPIECKVSNSAVNSYKRVCHEARGKATGWLHGFGERHVVPAAVLGGVFTPENLATAQASGLYLFWGFRLRDLGRFLKLAA